MGFATKVTSAIRSGFGFLFGSKKMGLLTVLILVPALVLASHEFSVRYFQDKTCVACHEMKEPIKRWKESGTAKNHGNCASCHFDAGFKGWWDMNTSALRLFVEHFNRDPNEPIKPKKEPLFLDEDKEPGYWSHVPNSRCFKCKNVENHAKKDQAQVHRKLIKDITNQPCKDCHNHEMHKGQKFYEKVLTEEEKRKGQGI
jgi:trimethylamine-N-oxide reductase (cytochrome c) cytochrome c-type subunit TorY